MSKQDWWAQQFEKNRGHLRAVAYRILGSAGEADDAVQEAWLRLSRSEATAIENLGGWLTTVVARLCLDTLRARSSRREDALSEAASNRPGVADPEQEALLADSVGLALLVMLDRLTPAERISFVLHDMFDVSFDEIASIVGRSATAARQLASRARRRVRGVGTPSQADPARQRKTIDAFLHAVRCGDFEGLLAVLDPEVFVRIDAAAVRPGAPREIRGAKAWAKGAIAFARVAGSLQPMLVDGTLGAVWAPGGRLLRAVRFKIFSGKIVEADIIADPARLSKLHLAAINQ